MSVSSIILWTYLIVAVIDPNVQLSCPPPEVTSAQQLVVHEDEVLVIAILELDPELGITFIGSAGLLGQVVAEGVSLGGTLTIDLSNADITDFLGTYTLFNGTIVGSFNAVSVVVNSCFDVDTEVISDSVSFSIIFKGSTDICNPGNRLGLY